MFTGTCAGITIVTFTYLNSEFTDNPLVHCEAFTKIWQGRYTGVTKMCGKISGTGSTYQNKKLFHINTCRDTFNFRTIAKGYV
jgi:hypothetical protein